MSDSPSHSDTPSPLTCPNQGTFRNEEQDFLKAFLPQYCSLLEDLSKVASGPRALKGTKGRKKNWVIEKVFPKFVSHFDSAGSNGPNLDSLKTVHIDLFISMPFVNSPPLSGDGEVVL